MGVAQVLDGVFLQISGFIETYYFFILTLFFGLAFFSVKRRSALLFALLAALLIGPALKEVFVEQRPCTLQASALPCPTDFGMPSLHAMSAALFAIAALGTPAFLIFAPAALIIGYSRIYLAFHSVEQVAAGFALAIAFYAFGMGLRAIIRKEEAFGQKEKAKAWGLMQEVKRQGVHVVFGSAIIALALILGMHDAVIVLTLALAAGIFALGLHLLKLPVPFAKQILFEFERGKVIPGKGAMHYAAGALLLMTLGKGEFALAMIAVLAFGDGASTAIGKAFGKLKLPWNDDKSWAGTLAFAVVGFAAAAFFLPLQETFAYSVLLALVESLPTSIDDNLMIPVSALALRAIFQALGI